MIKPLSAARIRGLKVLVFIICLIPMGLLVYGVFSGSISGDPVETMTHVTGEWGLRFLLITLCITPLRRLLNFPDLVKFRRMFGLYAFFYALCHLSVYVVFDQFFDLAAIIDDVVERKYIFAGMLAFILMIPLAVTSTNGMIKRLGGKRWQKLHKLVYVVGVAAVIHLIWLVKADYSEAAVYALILTILLAYRWVTRKKPARA